MKTLFSILGTIVLAITLFGCGETATPTPAVPDDGFGTKGGMSMKINGKEWVCEKTSASYDPLYKTHLISGERENTVNPEDPLMLFNLVIPADIKLNTPTQIGKKNNLPNIPYLFLISATATTGFGYGIWDSRDGQSDGTITITARNATEIAGTIKGDYWDINSQRISGRVTGSTAITEGKFRVLLKK
jgi:hypothetical protein